MLSFLAEPGPLMALYAINALWFFSGFYCFVFKPAFIMRDFSKRQFSHKPSIRNVPDGDVWHHDIMAYLGALNASLTFLALLRLYAIWFPSKYLSSGTSQGDISLDIMSLLVLCSANMSQAIINFHTALQGDRWVMGRGLDIITVMDAVLTVLDLTAIIGKASQM
ncbi:hypothetical protein B0I35DRAFT_474170 [Stachybotrys elegans]|uniref:Uncharacterized protein n=1 Tax=Stachybotrys elegans TaxID=80388 RepID=A0A8K0T9C7_9HYPO|nr:hypothetical protein B0I35DRAFT_474170 [Stachybotrys elegans]